MFVAHMDAIITDFVAKMDSFYSKWCLSSAKRLPAWLYPHRMILRKFVPTETYDSPGIQAILIIRTPSFPCGGWYVSASPWGIIHYYWFAPRVSGEGKLLMYLVPNHSTVMYLPNSIVLYCSPVPLFPLCSSVSSLDIALPLSTWRFWPCSLPFTFYLLAFFFLFHMFVKHEQALWHWVLGKGKGKIEIDFVCPLDFIWHHASHTVLDRWVMHREGSFSFSFSTKHKAWSPMIMC